MGQGEVRVGVAAVIRDLRRPGAVLMGRRLGEHQRGTWCVPGGWMDTTDVSFVEAARRETAEEVGLILPVTPAGLFEPTTEMHPTFRTATIYVPFVIEGSDATYPGLEPDKCAEWTWVTLDILASLHRANAGSIFPNTFKVLESMKRWTW